MRIDVHTHIFPPEIVEDRGRYFSGEPMFRLLYDTPRARLADAERLLGTMDREDIDAAVVFGFPWKSLELAARHNDYVLETAARYAPRLIPMGCVNPLDKAASKEAERCLRSGAVGLGELAIYEDCNADQALKRFEPIIDCCRAHRRILLVHANEPVGHAYPGKAPLGLDFYYALAERTRDVPMILAHWGGGLCFYELLRKEAQEVLENVYYDTAASPFLYKPGIYAHMVALLRPGKILMGSDYPLLAPRRCFQDMGEAGLTEAQIEAIGGGNAQALFEAYLE